IAQNASPALPTLADWTVNWVLSESAYQATKEPAYRDWERRLMEARLICPEWPEAVGGRSWDGVRLALFNYECHKARVPRVTRGPGESLCGPSVIEHGTEEQKARFLPPIIDGRDVYCQG